MFSREYLGNKMKLSLIAIIGCSEIQTMLVSGFVSSTTSSYMTGSSTLMPFKDKQTHPLNNQFNNPLFHKVLYSLQNSNLDQRETTTTTTTTTTTNAKIIDEQILSQLEKCTSGTRAREILTQAVITPNKNNNINDDQNYQPLFNSLRIPPLASSKYLSDAELAIQTQIRNQKRSVTDLIELNGDADADRASLFLLGLMIASPLTAIQIQQFTSTVIMIPDIFRFVLVWFFSFLPLIFVGAGLSVPQSLQRQLMLLQGLFFPSYKKRWILHEAGHLLMGHLLGLPIQSYQVNSNAMRTAVEFYPLADENVGRSRAKSLGFDKLKIDNNSDYDSISNERITTSDRPFFSEGGRGDELLQKSILRDVENKDENGKIQSKSWVSPQNDPTSVWPYRKLDEATLDILSVISLAGVVSEILAFGDAQGGYADLSQLTAFLKSNECTDEEVEKKIRFAIGYNFSQLRRHLGVLDQVANVMEKDRSVTECILVMESCDNIAGPSTIMERYEDQRKHIFAQERSLLEKALLGGRDVNGEQTDIIEGKGGGDRKEKFIMTGDDPFYAAAALAFIFFIWASSGGLTLH